MINNPTIGIFHPNPMAGGGAEAVFANVVESIDDYNITIYTYNEIDWSILNKYHQTGINYGDIKVTQIANLDHINHIPNLLNKSISRRYLDGIVGKYDVFVSTSNEIPPQENVIQYIHFPIHHRHKTPECGTILRAFYDYLCLYTSGCEELSKSAQIITNSAWTGEVLHNIYNIECNIVSPPICFNSATIPFCQQENGIVSVGRISSDKQTYNLINIIDILKDNGSGLHLHIIGESNSSSYSDTIIQAANSRDYVFYEGKLSRPQLEQMLVKHKHGLHPKSHEHYGMVVAEYILSETIPVIPNTGGQKEIVTNPDLRYDSLEEAADILADLELQEQHFNDIIDVSSSRILSPNDFQEKFRSVVKSHI
jgi:glycosyltransferase involved in cell wall biosynthesis